jgi:hypothetical protein
MDCRKSLRLSRKEKKRLSADEIYTPITCVIICFQDIFISAERLWDANFWNFGSSAGPNSFRLYKIKGFSKNCRNIFQPFWEIEISVPKLSKEIYFFRRLSWVRAWWCNSSLFLSLCLSVFNRSAFPLFLSFCLSVFNRSAFPCFFYRSNLPPIFSTYQYFLFSSVSCFHEFKTTLNFAILTQNILNLYKRSQKNVYLFFPML